VRQDFIYYFTACQIPDNPIISSSVKTEMDLLSL